MSGAEIQQVAIGALQGLASSTIVILVLFIGFCMLLGLLKLKRTAGGGAPVIKSLDETLSHQAMTYMPPTTPRGVVDQLRAPELLEAAARK